MSKRRDFDKPPADLIPAKPETAAPDPTPAAPVIRSVAPRSGRATGRRSSPARKPSSGFDASAISRLVHGEAESADSPESEETPASDVSTTASAPVVSTPASAAPTLPVAARLDDSDSQRQPAAEKAVVRSTAPTDVKPAAPSADVAVEVPDVPVVRPNATPVSRDRKRPGTASTRRPGKNRAAGPRKGRPLPTAWIAVGGGGVFLAILLALVILSNQPDDSAKNPTSRARPAAGNFSGSPPAGRSFQPGPFSPNGVRRMDPAEQTSRRERLNSFAEMGRAEEAKLHAEQQKQNSDGNSP